MNTYLSREVGAIQDDQWNTQIENIRVGNHTLLNTDVQKLVEAMATLTPPVSGQMTLSVAQQNALASVIAANWH